MNPKFKINDTVLNIRKDDFDWGSGKIAQVYLLPDKTYEYWVVWEYGLADHFKEKELIPNTPLSRVIYKDNI